MSSPPCFLLDHPRKHTTDRALLSPSRARPEALTKRPCPVCTANPAQPFLVEERDWDSHLRTRTHRSALKRNARAEERRRYLEQRDATAVAATTKIETVASGSDSDPPEA